MILLYSHKNDPVTEDLISSGVPFILVGKPASEEGDQSFIDNDNIAAAREAAAYLAGLGHTKIGFLSNRSEEQFNADRKAGYLLALAEHALPIRPEWILESDGTKERTEELLGQFLSLPELPSALLAVDDLLAVLTMRQVLAKGLRIPEDLSIVSFNDSLLSRITLPALTSVDVQAERLGVEAAAQLLMRLDHPDLPANKVIVPHRLVIRESCTAVSTS
jgi:DNA-binding LacI/PurR family transcriptional regulator